MATKTISLYFDGYWMEPEISEVPKQSGIFVVYACAKDAQEAAFVLKKVIYIGESENVNQRIAKYKEWPFWKNHCGAHQICFSFAHVADQYRKRSEAALIYKHKPPVNERYIVTYPFDETSINLSGKIGLLSRNYTVNRKD